MAKYGVVVTVGDKGGTETFIYGPYDSEAKAAEMAEEAGLEDDCSEATHGKMLPRSVLSAVIADGKRERALREQTQ